jgi:galactokinase
LKNNFKEVWSMPEQSVTNSGKVSQLADTFCEIFNKKPIVVRSPGRINIIGEHTDYNEGFVLPAAIDKAAYLATSPRDDHEIHLIAADLDKTFSINLEELRVSEKPTWPNYILGVVAQFQKKGIPLSGFNAILSSDVPIGAGLSSSAAVECATVYALNSLFGVGLSKLEMIKMAQLAEHEYAGVMCGIMDQFASMMGVKDHLIKLDCRSLEYTYEPFKLNDLKVVLFDTNVKHSLASSEYNVRREECNQAVDWIKAYEKEVHSLRDVTELMLDKYVLPRDPLIDKRSRFVVQEITRLQKACTDLEKGDVESLGKKMFETHEGLSTQYEVSCPELDFLVNYVKGNQNVAGARMMGGGFGGCTINLVNEAIVDNLIENISESYFKKMGRQLTSYVVTIEQGTSVVF